MGLTDKYFTNAANFKKIAKILRTDKTLPDQVTKRYIYQFGFTDPADDLILNFFKELQFLDDDNSPTELLENFRDPATSKKAMAAGILEAYGDLFEEDPAIYQKSKENIVNLLGSLLEEDKSSVIINYMANTFRVLVKYAGQESLEEVLEKRENDMASENEKQDAKAEQHRSDIGRKNQAVAEETNSMSNNGEVLKSEALSVVDNGEIEYNDKQIVDYVNKAYVKKADLLYRQKRYEDALPALDKVFKRFADSDDDKLYEFASVALYKKMKTAEKLELNDYLIQIYSSVIDRFGSHENSAFIAAADHAYTQLVEIMIAAGETEEALETIEQAICRFKDIQPNSDLMAKMMFTKAELYETEDSEKAIEAYDEFLRVFG